MGQQPIKPNQAVYIVISKAEPGHWFVCSSDNSIGGIFIQYDRALAFARQEATFRPNAVVVDESGRAVP